MLRFFSNYRHFNELENGYCQLSASDPLGNAILLIGPKGYTINGSCTTVFLIFICGIVSDCFGVGTFSSAVEFFKIRMGALEKRII